MAWMLQGKKNPDFLGASGCKTDIKSEIEVIGLSGTIPMTSKPCDVTSCVPTWSDIERPTEIKWKVETLSDGKGEPDRVEVELQYFDMAYVTQVTESAMDSMTDEQMDLALTDTAEFSNILLSLVSDTMNPALTLKTVYSDQTYTTEDGFMEGVINIPPEFPVGTYTLMVHYGYSAEVEKSDSKKAVDFWVYEMVPMIIEVVASIAAIFLTGGAALAMIMVATAAAAFDIANIATQYQQSRFGIIGENQHGCDFPYGGYIQSYSISWELKEEAETLADIFDQNDNTPVLGALNTYIATQDLVKVALGGSLAVALLFIIGYKIKGRKRG